MKRFLRITLIVVAALVTLFLYLFQVNNEKLNEELNYHFHLHKTINLKSTAFGVDGTIPLQYTAKGSNISPPLNWQTIPEGTKSLAIIVSDYDAPSPNVKLFIATHWVLYNIPANADSIQQGITEAQLSAQFISAGKNYAGKHVYAGPYPPFGVHNYYFRIYALDYRHLFLANDNREELYKAMKGHILGYGELVGRF